MITMKCNFLSSYNSSSELKEYLKKICNEIVPDIVTETFGLSVKGKYKRDF